MSRQVTLASSWGSIYRMTIPPRFKKDQSPKKRQEILDDWNVKILPSKNKQIQIQRRNADPRIYYRREIIICHQLQKELNGMMKVVPKSTNT